MRPLSSFLNEKFNFLADEYQNKINIFDLDDTIVISAAKIKVTDTETGEKFELTPSEFNNYIKKDSHVQDYSDFHSLEILKGSKIIEWVFNILKQTLKKRKAVGIITARADVQLIKDFFLHHGIRINTDFIIAINDPKFNFKGTVAQKKEQAFYLFKDMGFTDFRFFDDAKENIDIANKFAKENKGVTMKAKLIDSKWHPKSTDF